MEHETNRDTYVHNSVLQGDIAQEDLGRLVSHSDI